jgi:hypothetical protein
MNKDIKRSARNKGTRSTFLKLKNLIKRIAGDKRQKFISSIILLSLGLFVSEHFLEKSGVYLIFALSLLTVVLLFLCLRKDLKDNFSWQIFILPFFFSLSFGLFYLLVPARYITRIIMTTLYAVGLYSLFLSENIFTVSSIRTIALLSSAKTVTVALTLLSFFFLSNVVFSLHLNIFLTLLLVLLYSFPIILQSIWIYTFEKKDSSFILWVISLTICILEVSVLLWFWPSTPTLIALFLSGIFYSILGLSHVWLEKRLFKGVIWEYSWVIIILLVVLVFFTSWT